MDNCDKYGFFHVCCIYVGTPSNQLDKLSDDDNTWKTQKWMEKKTLHTYQYDEFDRMKYVWLKFIWIACDINPVG